MEQARLFQFLKPCRNLRPCHRHVRGGPGLGGFGAPQALPAVRPKVFQPLRPAHSVLLAVRPAASQCAAPSSALISRDVPLWSPDSGGKQNAVVDFPSAAISITPITTVPARTLSHTMIPPLPQPVISRSLATLRARALCERQYVRAQIQHDYHTQDISLLHNINYWSDRRAVADLSYSTSYGHS